MLGSRFMNKWGTWVEIVAYKGTRNLSVRYEYDKALCAFDYVQSNNRLTSLKNGTFRGPFCRSMCGVGYIGLGPHSPMYKDDSGVYAEDRSYTLWCGIINRCYSERRGPLNNYDGVFVSESWLNYQNFADWAKRQNGFYKDGWQIDKDVLSKPGKEKTYSATNCAFIPHQLNLLFRLTVDLSQDKNKARLMELLAEYGHELDYRVIKVIKRKLKLKKSVKRGVDKRAKS